MRIIWILLPLFLILNACAPATKREHQTREREIETGSVSSSDSLTIFYRRAGQGRVALLFLHGWCIDGSYWQPQLRHLSDRYTVVAIDLPGHGRSGQARTSWSMQAYGDDVRQVAEALQLDTLVLVGHSMSDAVALEAARLLPGKVIALLGVDTFVEPGTPISEDESAPFFAQLDADFGGTVRAWIGSYFPAAGDSSLQAQILDDMAEGPPGICIPVLRAVFDYQKEDGYRAALQELRVPIHTLNAVPPDVAAWEATGVSFSWDSLQDVGHYPMLEDSVQLNAALDRALAKPGITRR